METVMGQRKGGWFFYCGRFLLARVCGREMKSPCRVTFNEVKVVFVKGVYIFPSGMRLQEANWCGSAGTIRIGHWSLKCSQCFSLHGDVHSSTWDPHHPTQEVQIYWPIKELWLETCFMWSCPEISSACSILYILVHYFFNTFEVTMNKTRKINNKDVTDIKVDVSNVTLEWGIWCSVHMFPIRVNFLNKWLEFLFSCTLFVYIVHPSWTIFSYK